MRGTRAPSRRMLLAGLGGTALGGGAKPGPAAAGPPAVPERFRSLYETLERFLDATLAELPPVAGEGPRPFAHLMSISGHRHEQALEPGWSAFHRLYAEGLLRLGIEGVEMEVSYPTFTPGFNKDLAPYLEAYREVGALARAMGQKVVAKHNPLVPALTRTPTAHHYDGLTRERFFAERYAEALLVLDVIDPDYFILCGEPGNIPPVDGRRMGLEDWRDYHHSFTQRLRNDRPKAKAKFGAAAGTWEDGALFEMFAEVPGLDLVDLHFYPIRAGREGEVDLLLRALDWVKAVRAKRPDMGVVIGEAWLYKTTPAEQIAGATAPEIFGRDLWSFWIPLDIKMLEAVKRIGALAGADYVSPFWTHLFFAYAEFGALAEGSIMVQRQLINERMLEALQRGESTPTGRAFTGA